MKCWRYPLCIESVCNITVMPAGPSGGTVGRPQVKFHEGPFNDNNNNYWSVYFLLCNECGEYFLWFPELVSYPGINLMPQCYMTKQLTNCCLTVNVLGMSDYIGCGVCKC